MDRSYKKRIYKDIKSRYSKFVYRNRRKIVNAFKEQYYNKFYELDYIDKNWKNKDSLDCFLIVATTYSKLTKELIAHKFNFDKDLFNKLLNKYGEYLLTNNTYTILVIEGEIQSEFYNSINKEFCNYAKKYPKEFEFLINNYEKYELAINQLQTKNIELESILKNIFKLQILKEIKTWNELSGNECEYLLNININEVNNVKNTYDLINKCGSGFGTNGRFSYHDIYKFLLLNPNNKTIEFLSEVFKERIENANLDRYFRDATDMEQIINLINYFINNNHSINNLKRYIEVLIFKFGGANFIDFKIDELPESDVDSYPENIREYLKFYRELKNINDTEQIKQYLERIKDFKILTYDQMCEFLLINYNKNLNRILLNPEKLESNENCQVRYQPVDYIENGMKVIKYVKIITIKSIPFTSLSTSIDIKSRNACLTDKQFEFNTALVDNPNLWLSKPKSGTNFISMSANKNNFFKTFGNKGQILAGFCNIKNKQIKRAFDGDAGTNMYAGTTISGVASDLESIDKITRRSSKSPFGSNKDYNEVISDREGVVPDYFFAATEENNARISLATNKRTLKWAAYFDKPIIEIDCESYYKEGINTFYENLKTIHNNPQVPTLEELKKLEILKVEAETFYHGYFIDYYDMIMAAIDMSNREWNLENIKGLEAVINEFNERDLLYEVDDSSLLEEQRALKEKERKETIKRLANILNIKRVEINNMNNTNEDNIDNGYNKK